MNSYKPLQTPSSKVRISKKKGGLVKRSPVVNSQIDSNLVSMPTVTGGRGDKSFHLTS